MTLTPEQIAEGNGQAFPAGDYTNGGHYGMTLRDWFAGQAMTAAAHGVRREDWREAARRAYAFADAMLAERERKP